MGNVDSKSGSIMKDPFTKDELRRLHKRFKKIDRDSSGALSIAEFMKLPGIKENPLAHRVINIFDTDKDGEVDFNEFIGGMSIFSTKSDVTQKLKFAFQVYDVDRDGFISNGDLFRILKMMVEDNLKDYQLQQLVDKTIIYFDNDNDGKLSFKEFTKALSTMEKLTEMSTNMAFKV